MTLKLVCYAAEIDTKKILALQKVECDRGRGGVTSRSSGMEPGAYHDTLVQISCQLILHFILCSRLFTVHSLWGRVGRRTV